MKFRCILSRSFGLALLIPLPFEAALAGDVVRSLDFEPAADATLYSNYPDPTANSLGQHLFVGYTFRQSVRRSLLRFDVAGCLPPQATVTGVSLTLNCSLRSIDSVSLVCSIHRVTSPWEEGLSRAQSPEGGGAPAGLGDPTWDHAQFNTIPWKDSGGDFETEAVATSSVTTLGTTTWSGPLLVALVQSWVDEPAMNFGMVLRGSELDEGSAKRFDSRNHLNPDNRPVLRVTYSLPDDEGMRHSADTSADGAISLSEILRVIQIYNAGEYSCGGGEDGFVLGTNGERTCPIHDLDYLEPQWRITLEEVLRGVQFYNAGALYSCSTGEDGWCPGLPPCETAP